MTETTKKALIGAAATVISGVVVFFLSNYSTQTSIVQELSDRFSSVDEKMSLSQALENIYKESENIKNENKTLKKETENLKEQLSSAQKQIEAKQKFESLIKTANSFADSGNYKNAINTLSNASEKTPEMELLIDEFSKKYESEIIDKATDLQKNKKYDEAIEEINNALELLPESEQLKSKRDSIFSDKPQNFMDLCAPYEATPLYKEFINGDMFMMSGKKRTNGFTTMGYNNQALSNLNGNYRELTFDVGHVDGSQMTDATLSIYLDGVFYSSYEIKSDNLPISVKVSLKGKKQIKFVFHAMYIMTLGFADMQIK